MRIGLALPSALGLTDGRFVAQWAGKAEAAGFASLVVIDRLVAPTWDPFVTLAAAGAVTERVELMTAVALGPLRAPALLASLASSVDLVSGGRLTLGLAVGSRRIDYDAVGNGFSQRGRLLDEQVAELRRLWSEPGDDFLSVGPRPVRAGGPPLLFGGSSQATFRRTARFGAGWINGSGGVAAFTAGAEAVQRAWQEAGRDGEPRLLAAISCAIGRTARDDLNRHLGTYYRNAPFLAGMLASAPTDLESLSVELDRYRAAGCDDVLLLPCSADPSHVELFAQTL